MSARHGIAAYGAYVPRHRLDRAAIRATLGAGGGKGRRTVAGYDEDTTSMGVEAARRLAVPAASVRGVHFVTTAPAYTDKTNATTIHAALGLADEVFAGDHVGAIRSAFAAAKGARNGDLVVLSDARTGRPGSADEAQGGDAAAAFLFAEGDDLVAEQLAEASVSAEFTDRWRVPGEQATRTWEDRFGLDEYVPLIVTAGKRALEAAGLESADHVVVSSTYARASAAAAKKLGGTLADGLLDEVGHAGAAHAGIVLADVLDRAEPGQTILVVVGADGADAVVLRATDALPARRSAPTVREQIADSRPVDYPTFLTWRGVLDRQPPRRPEPERPAAPASARNSRWKFALRGTRCTSCDYVHLPPQRVCVQCATVDEMESVALADRTAKVATYTIDHLAYSMSPPVIEAVVELDGGGRFGTEVTEADPDDIAVGVGLEMTFRRMYTADGIHNYFWKARPTVGAADDAEDAR